MKSNKKKWLIIILCIIFVIVAALFIAYFSIMNKTKNTIINSVDLSKVPDGEYIGDYSIPPVQVRVKVTVKDHQMEEIEILKHLNGLGSSAEKITESIMKNQLLTVDAVSGATVSSKCILKAVEIAVKSGVEGE